MIMQIMINWLQILMWPMRPYKNTELWAKEIGEFSITLDGKMGWWVFFCPPSLLPQYKSMAIF